MAILTLNWQKPDLGDTELPHRHGGGWFTIQPPDGSTGWCKEACVPLWVVGHIRAWGLLSQLTPGNEKQTSERRKHTITQLIPVKLPWIFPGAPLKSMGLLEISRATWQVGQLYKPDIIRETVSTILHCSTAVRKILESCPGSSLLTAWMGLLMLPWSPTHQCE